MNRQPPTWFLYLEIVRIMKGEVNSTSFASKSDLEPEHASAWLCKMVRWGYLRRAGPSRLGGKRVRYELTDYGKDVQEPKVKRKFKAIPGRPGKRLRIAANPPKEDDDA